MTIKFALCGGEWINGIDTRIHEPKPDCPLSELMLEKGHPEAINAAIEAAKVDMRGVCGHLGEDERGRLVRQMPDGSELALKGEKK